MHRTKWQLCEHVALKCSLRNMLDYQYTVFLKELGVKVLSVTVSNISINCMASCLVK